MRTLVRKVNGLSQEIVPNLRILRKIGFCVSKKWILTIYTPAIGFELASPTRSHNPFPAVSAKNAVSENCYCQILRKFSEKFGTIFAENPLRFWNADGSSHTEWQGWVCGQANNFKMMAISQGDGFQHFPRYSKKKAEKCKITIFQKYQKNTKKYKNHTNCTAKRCIWHRNCICFVLLWYFWKMVICIFFLFLLL